MEILLNREQVAEIFGKTPRQVSNYHKEGLKYKKIGREYKYEPRETVIWGIEKGLFNNSISFGIDRESLPPDLRDKLASAELKEEKLKIIRAEYGPIAKMQAIAYAIGKVVNDSVMSIPSRISTIVAKESDDFECEKIMRDEFSKVLADVAEQVENVTIEMEDAAKEAKV